MYGEYILGSKKNRKVQNVQWSCFATCMYGKHNYILCACIVEAQANLLNTLERKFRRIYVFILYQIKKKDRNSILNNPIRHVTHFQSTLVRSPSLSLGAPKCPEGSHP